MRAAPLSAREARWLAIEAQGLGRPRRKTPITAARLADTVAAIGTIQLDAVNVLERTQFVVLFSRLGAYDVGRLHAITGPGGALFEYWGHAASLLPVATQPLFRWRMQQHGTVEAGGGKYAEAWREWRTAETRYIAAVLEEVGERGPLAASALTDRRPQQGQWWARRSAGRLALEWLFSTGQLAAWRSANFERVYDLPERVIPPAVLATPTPPMEEAHRKLLAMAAASLGVATIGDLADYYRIKPTLAKRGVADLVEANELLPVEVEGWPHPAFCLPTARPRRPSRSQATLLSPFDSLIWNRDRTERLFGFEYRIEVYVPQPRRRYGYYVLPLLHGDNLVGRLDLKADRQARTLRVNAAHVESDATPAAVAAAALVELDALRHWLALDAITAAASGNLAASLRDQLG